MNRQTFKLYSTAFYTDTEAAIIKATQTFGWFDRVVLNDRELDYTSTMRKLARCSDIIFFLVAFKMLTAQVC